MMAITAGTGGTRYWDNAGYGFDEAATTSSSRRAESSSADPERNQNESPDYMTDEEYWATFPETLTTTDLAVILRVGKPAVRSRLRSNIIPAHLVSGSWIIFKQEIRAWLASTSNQPPVEPLPAVDVLAPYGEEMTYRDLMNLFGKTKQTIYIWLSEGHIPASHTAGHWLIFKSQIEQLLAETSNQNVEGN
jgi:hypothetical protein